MPIQKESLVDIVVERIKEDITKRNLQPNDKYLSEKELVHQLQVSRTVVREALISLQSVGVLKIKRGGGVYIENPTLDTIKEILKHHYDTYGVKIRELAEIRKIIELGAIRLIIEKAINVNFKQLEEINESYYQAIIEKQDTREDDRLFHLQLIKATENETFYHFSEIIHDYFSLTKIDLVQKEKSMIQSYYQHQELIQLIKEGNLSKAQEMISLHLEPVFTFIDQMEGKAPDGTN